MKKHRLGLLRWAVVSGALGVWSSSATAVDQPAPAAGAPQPSAPSSARGRLVPEQFSLLFKVNDDNPEAYVPTVKDRIRNPLEFGYYVQDLLTRAEVESKRNNQPGVVKYLRALAATLPEEARSWGLLCEAYQKAQDRDHAVRACKYAIERQGAELKDYQRYVDLMTAKPGELLSDERSELNEVIDHLDKQPNLAIPAAHLRCQAAVKANDESALEACTAVLAKAAPNDPKTVVFQWSLAVMHGDKKQAASLLARAEKMGLAAASLDRMHEVAVDAHGWSSPIRGLGGVIVGGAAILLGLLLFVGYRRRLATGPRRLAQ